MKRDQPELQINCSAALCCPIACQTGQQRRC